MFVKVCIVHLSPFLVRCINQARCSAALDGFHPRLRPRGSLGTTYSFFISEEGFSKQIKTLARGWAMQAFRRPTPVAIYMRCGH